ncbi:hypothetical protein ONS95_006431 [Cadophora gregata]|uniref:uncharacterized protein n=1 Tax=Cadophora gregata TaxID=51156 RepID=UPI0026DCF37B|nr:uncharacterized protein ONS95_006431 [Cadophora gregata]KAK0101252.1 hypothetical protein ONS95_006431 [Cadophora gregata]
MAPGGPPGGARGRGGKFKKFTRGGGKHFSKNLRPLDADGNEIEEKDPNASSSEEEETSSEEESSEEEDANKPALTREERRQAAKAKKEAAIARKKGKVVEAGDMPSSSEEDSEDDDMPANPNHSKAARNQAKAAPASVEEVAEGVKDMSVGKGKKPVAELSRREREAVQAQQAKERYQKLHEAGKTDEAKADMARLKLIREKREAEAARKQVCSFPLQEMCKTNMCRPRKRSARSPRRRRRPRLTPAKPSEGRQQWAQRRARARQRSKLQSLFIPKFVSGCLTSGVQICASLALACKQFPNCFSIHIFC